MPESGDILIIRIRHFSNFQNPFIIACVEEYTLYNKSDDAVDSLSFNIGSFKSNLHVIDANGEYLPFHTDLKNYYRDDDISSEEKNQINNGIIKIELSKKNKICSGDYRIIRLEYTYEIESYTEEEGRFVLSFPLDDAPRNYVEIRPSRKFSLKAHSLFYKSDGKYYSLDSLKENDAIQLFESDTRITIISKKSIPNCDFRIYIKHRLSGTQKKWFELGYAFVLIVTLMNILLCFTQSNECLPILITVNSIVISYLLLSKGWLYDFEIDKIVSIDLPFGRFGYDKAIIWSVYFLFVQVILIILFFSILKFSNF
ncbi:hypothetical protein AZH53_07745 [Methanomicrobiaceae archaeon CYW5]|uniref:hypothetical protein n=1 Tax=Methanovulcanius yangii TaxID=1789227 RepID=UPI0029CA2DDD|nr:hypothetical protein [Methanovulcanius yangii]MBT8508296.1 hypothetical protein [Methanovulcanius yangii]